MLVLGRVIALVENIQWLRPVVQFLLRALRIRSCYCYLTICYLLYQVALLSLSYFYSISASLVRVLLCACAAFVFCVLHILRLVHGSWLLACAGDWSRRPTADCGMKVSIRHVDCGVHRVRRLVHGKRSAWWRRLRALSSFRRVWEISILMLDVSA